MRVVFAFFVFCSAHVAALHKATSGIDGDVLPAQGNGVSVTSNELKDQLQEAMNEQEQLREEIYKSLDRVKTFGAHAVNVQDMSVPKEVLKDVKDAIKAEQALNAAKSQTEAEGKPPSASVQQALKKAIPAEWTAAGTGLFKDDEASETLAESSSLESDTTASAEDDNASTDPPVSGAPVRESDTEDASTHQPKKKTDGDAVPYEGTAAGTGTTTEGDASKDKEAIATQVETVKKDDVVAVPYEWTAAATGTQSEVQNADTKMSSDTIGDEAAQLSEAAEADDEQIADEVSVDQDAKKIPREWTAAATGTANSAVKEASETSEHADSSGQSAKVPFEWTAAGVAAQSLMQNDQVPEEGSDMALFGQHKGEQDSDAALYGGQAAAPSSDQGGASVEEEEDSSKESDVALYSQNTEDYAESDKALFAASFLQVKAAPKQAPAKIASLPEQGYEGKSVKHQNMKSITSDWGGEYGPKPVHAGAQGTTVAVVITVMATTTLML